MNQKQSSHDMKVKKKRKEGIKISFADGFVVLASSPNKPLS